MSAGFRRRALTWFQRKGAPYFLRCGGWFSGACYRAHSKAIVAYRVDCPGGWVWWARGRMGEARSLHEAKVAAEAELAKEER
jgi:hypothetical protein